MELTKEILEKAYKGFKVLDEKEESSFGLDWEKLTDYEITNDEKDLFEFGINPMLDILKVDRISLNVPIHLLNQEEFMYVTYLATEDPMYTFKSTGNKEEALKLYNNTEKVTESGLTKILQEVFTKSQAMAIGYTVVINRTAVPKTVGLHLICHEIMHLLANTTTVTEMRTPEPNLQDEAVNEFFARLATYFYINHSADKRVDYIKNVGLTSFSTIDDKDTYHDRELGLYGKFMRKDKYLQYCFNKSDENCVDSIKKLAQFYFKGDKDPMI